MNDRRARSAPTGARPRHNRGIAQPMFSAIVPEKRYTSCNTRLKNRRSSSSGSSRISTPRSDPATRHVVETQQQVDDCRLSRPRSPDHPDPFARLDVERHILEHVVAPVEANHTRSKMMCPAPRIRFGDRRSQPVEGISGTNHSTFGGSRPPDPPIPIPTRFSLACPAA